MEALKKQILDNVTVIDTEKLNYVDVTKYKHLVRDNNIWTDAIQTAIDNDHYVYIPKMNDTIYLDDHLVLPSNTHIKVDPDQMIALVPGTNTCLLRNKNLYGGNDKEVFLDNYDENISICGGIWSEKDNAGGLSDKENSILGLRAIFLLVNIKNVNVVNVKFHYNTDFAVQISNVENYLFDNVEFLEGRKDGIHVNGPAKYGIITNLSGKDMGDDMIALNAWDWRNSAGTFGSITYLYVENVISSNNEIRLLPGEKIFSDGKSVRCDIAHCILKNIVGVYTYKLYGQPNILNVFDKNLNDSTGYIGSITDVYFENISVPKPKQAGFNDLPVKGIFEICSDCSDISIKNAKIDLTETELEKFSLPLIKVGPMSATWTSHSDDPAMWGEVFYPDAVCTAENITVENVHCLDESGNYVAIKKQENIAKAIHLTVNPDYPNTLPKGGTGYGTLTDLKIK